MVRVVSNNCLESNQNTLKTTNFAMAKDSLQLNKWINVEISPFKIVLYRVYVSDLQSFLSN